MFPGEFSRMCPILLIALAMALSSCSFRGRFVPKGWSSCMSCVVLTPHARRSWSAHPSVLMTNCPSVLARCRTISYRVRTSLMDSRGPRAKLSISVMATNRDSSPSCAKRACRPYTMYDTGSTMTPFIIPPWVISWGVRVRASSLAAPSSRKMIAATC